MSDPAGELSPLRWCITAMNETAGRLPSVRASDRPRGFAAIGEAVWWVTIVDATMLRHHPQAYDRVMAGQGIAQRTLIEGTLAGLRFVRNRMGQDADPADFIDADAGHGPGDNRMTHWRWKSLPEPELTPLSPRGQAWEMTRYEAYEARLAGQRIGSTFSCAAAFLNLTAAEAAVSRMPMTR